VSGSGVTVCAPAKINLFLHVGELRRDGYHELESLVAFADFGDRLEFAPASELVLKLRGPFASQVPRDGDNLVLKAARALDVSGGATITLEKNLPVEAGLGGGSSDGAAALRGLNALWQLGRPEDELIQLAASLGSDVPACVLSRPCWMEGRGERVSPTEPLPMLSLVLVNPGVMLPTKAVFATLNARSGLGAMRPPRTPIRSIWDLVAYLKNAENDLEAPACRLRPVIDDVLEALNHEPGCVLAQMSGSGATCFALFDGHQFALGAAERIAEENPTWWVRAAKLASADIGAPQQLSET